MSYSAAPNNDAMSVGELSTLTAFELGQELNKIDVDYDKLTPAAVTLEKALGQAEDELERHPDDRDLRGKVKKAKRELSAIDRQIKHLNKRQSRIQSLIRAMNI